MKKILFLSILLAGSFAAQAQKIKKENVPAAVAATFAKRYPNATDVAWEKEDVHYEAGFRQNNVEHSVLLDANGNVVETETEIAVTALPATAREYLAKNYPNQKVKEAAQITDAQATVTYEAELEGVDVLFTATGQFIKTVKKD